MGRGGRGDGIGLKGVLERNQGSENHAEQRKARVGVPWLPPDAWDTTPPQTVSPDDRGGWNGRVAGLGHGGGRQRRQRAQTAVAHHSESLSGRTSIRSTRAGDDGVNTRSAFC